MGVHNVKKEIVAKSRIQVGMDAEEFFPVDAKRARGGLEKAYSYKYLRSTTSLTAGAYFKVTCSGMYQAGDYFALIRVKAAGSTVVQAGWKRTYSGTRWFLTVDDGINSLTVFSRTCPTTWRWYNICLRWIGCDKEGSAELYVDGKLVCFEYGMNTTGYGLANRVEFGLPLLYSCAATKVYVDNYVKSYA